MIRHIMELEGRFGTAWKPFKPAGFLHGTALAFAAFALTVDQDVNDDEGEDDRPFGQNPRTVHIHVGILAAFASKTRKTSRQKT